MTRRRALGVSVVRAAPYPRRQQAYRLKRAAGAAAGAVAITAAGVVAALAGLTALAVVLLLTAGAVGLYARHWARLARRSQAGARSEDQVRHALATLEREGWRLHHSLAWHHGGDIDHVAIAPTGIAFAIDTKTRTYNPVHLTKVNEQAAWLRHHRRRWVPPRRATSALRHARTRRVDPTRRPRGLRQPPRESATCRGRHERSAEVPHCRRAAAGPARTRSGPRAGALVNGL
jgi:hypothetical protein